MDEARHPLLALTESTYSRGATRTGRDAPWGRCSGIEIVDVLLRDVKLPQRFRESIEAKLTA